MNKLDQLQGLGTIVVADTGDINEIKSVNPHDATTNPSLVLKAIEKNDNIIKDILKEGNVGIDLIIDKINVKLGTEISKHIPGYISTEVDARLSFDTNKTISRAKQIIALYEKNGVNRDRVLIKIASTWQGIQAAKELEKDGIKCNLTLLFSLTQAIACADAKVTLISPFVGRIFDWYKDNKIEYNLDPGVKSVLDIFKYYKSNDIKTIIMGASFRSVEQICLLAGCDRLTISPKLINMLKDDNDQINSEILKLNLRKDIFNNSVSESDFYWKMSQDTMATYKLNEGIHKFADDIRKLETIVNKAIHTK